MAATLDTVLGEIASIQRAARGGDKIVCPQWPMIVLRSPKGWTGPKTVDGLKTEGYWRAHQVPIPDMATPEHVKLLEDWMRSYRPQELFDHDGRLRPEIVALAPEGDRRMIANPHANGGLLRRELIMPDFADYAVTVTAPGQADGEATRVMGVFLRDVMKHNHDFRCSAQTRPPRTGSPRCSRSPIALAETLPEDDHLAPRAERSGGSGRR